MTIIHSEQLVLRQKLLDLMQEVLSEKADSFFSMDALFPAIHPYSVSLLWTARPMSFLPAWIIRFAPQTNR